MTPIKYFLLNNVTTLSSSYQLFDIWNGKFYIKRDVINFTIRKINNETN